MKAQFITLEGLEGAGKSTQCAKIADYLSGQGISVFTTQEPGGTQLGSAIRRWLLAPSHSISAMTELLLFYAARSQHIEAQIKPALQRGRWVICDRFIDSSYAYQGGGRQLPLDFIAQLNRYTVPLKPDLSLLLDMPTQCIRQRINPDYRDRFEREDLAFFERVRAAYLECAKDAPQRIKIINAEQSIAQVSAAIIEKLQALMR